MSVFDRSKAEAAILPSRRHVLDTGSGFSSSPFEGNAAKPRVPDVQPSVVLRNRRGRQARGDEGRFSYTPASRYVATGSFPSFCPACEAVCRQRRTFRPRPVSVRLDWAAVNHCKLKKNSAFTKRTRCPLCPLQRITRCDARPGSTARSSFWCGGPSRQGHRQRVSAHHPMRCSPRIHRTVPDDARITTLSVVRIVSPVGLRRRFTPLSSEPSVTPVAAKMQSPLARSSSL